MKRHTRDSEALQHAEAGAERGEEEELEDAAGDAVDGVNGADLVVAEAESSGELEGEAGVGLVGNHARVVEEDGHDLVVRDGMQGQEGVREQVDAGLGGEDFLGGDGIGAARGLVGVGHGRLGQQRGRGLVVDEGQPSLPLVHLGPLGPMERAGQLLAQHEAPVALVAFAVERLLRCVSVRAWTFFSSSLQGSSYTPAWMRRGTD